MASLFKPLTGERRLFELLEEQQEPFLLDVYLLENGYSDRFIDTKSSNVCWPGNACRRLMRMSSSAFRRRSVGLMRCMVSKLLRGRTIRKELNWDKQSHANGRWSLSDCFLDMRNKTRMSKFDRLSCSGGDLESEAQWKCYEDSSPLSPVSVLDLDTDDCSPIHDRTKEEKSSISKQVLGIFEELLKSSYSSPVCQYSKTKRELDRSKQLVLDCEKEAENQIRDSNQCLDPETARKIIDEHLSLWEKQRVDLSSITKLISSDISNSKNEWSHFQHEFQEIGAEIEAAISEEIIAEIVFDILACYSTL